MKVVKPIKIDSSNLLSSSIAELYNFDTSNTWIGNKYYCKDDIVKSSGIIYRAIKPEIISSTVSFTSVSGNLAAYLIPGVSTNTPVVFKNLSGLPSSITAGNVYYITIQGEYMFFSNTIGGGFISYSYSSGQHTMFPSTNYNKDPAVNSTYWLNISNIIESDPAAYVSTNVYILNEYVSYNKNTYRCRSGKSSAVDFNLTDNTVLWTAHGFTNPVEGQSPVRVSFTGTTLPTGISSGTAYAVFVVDADSFKIQPIGGGGYIDLGGSFSGVTARAGTSYNKTPDVSLTDWVYVKPTNRYRMFDGVIETKSQDVSKITFSVKPGVVVDTVAILGVNARTVKLSTSSGVTREVSVSNRYCTNYYDYFFKEFNTKTDAIFNDFIVYSTDTIQVEVIGYESYLTEVGAVVIGKSTDLGFSEYGLSFAIQDYSKKVTDEFGYTSVTKRAFSKKMNVAVAVPNNKLDSLLSTVIAYRAEPVLWIASNTWDATTVYGYMKDFDTVINFPTYSKCNLSIESLT